MAETIDSLWIKKFLELIQERIELYKDSNIYWQKEVVNIFKDILSTSYGTMEDVAFDLKARYDKLVAKRRVIDPPSKKVLSAILMDLDDALQMCYTAIEAHG